MNQMNQVNIQQLAMAIVSEARKAGIDIDRLIEEMQKLNTKKNKNYSYKVTLDEILKLNDREGTLDKISGQKGLEDYIALLKKFEAKVLLDSYEERLLEALDIRFGKSISGNAKAYRLANGIPMIKSGQRSRRGAYAATPHPTRMY
jgi:hypothetical protein